MWRGMGTALIYLVVLLFVAAVFFVGASAVFGRGEELAPIPPGTTPTWLPDQELGADHLRSVRFQQAVRGYKMAEVDWVLDRLAGELDRKAEESDGLRCRIVELESAIAGAKQADVAALVSGGTTSADRAGAPVGSTARRCSAEHAPGCVEHTNDRSSPSHTDTDQEELR